MKYIILLAILLFPTAALAQDINQSPYKVTPEIEIPMTVGVAIAVGIPRFLEIAPADCGSCDIKDINSLDRTAVGYHSGSANAISNAGFIASMLIPVGAATLDTILTEPTDGWLGYGKDILILTETLVFNLAANNVLNLAVRRPRPLAYDTINFSEEERVAPAYSFPSGHTSAAFAMGTAYSRLYMLRHPDSPWVAPVWIGTYSLAAITGVSRVFAGEHFWTDIMAGAGLGIATGLIVPWLHEKNEETRVVVLPVPYNKGAGLSVSIKN